MSTEGALRRFQFTRMIAAITSMRRGTRTRAMESSREHNGRLALASGAAIDVTGGSHLT